MKEHVWINSRGQRLSAMLHKCNSAENSPLIIICHGFTADKIGTNQLNLLLANSIQRAGFHALRFDFLGSGDSDGSFLEDTTVSGWREDLSNVVECVRDHIDLRHSPVYLLGHSLGGCVVLLHENNDVKIRGRILLAPVIHPASNFQNIIFGLERWNKALSGATISNFLDKGFSISKNFVYDLVESNHLPLQSANSYTDPILLIHGTNDQVVPYEGSVTLFQQYQGEKELHSIAESNHVFLNFMDEVQDKVINWLNNQVSKTM